MKGIANNAGFRVGHVRPVNTKEPDDKGDSPAASLWKDLANGWVDIAYPNQVPALAVFEAPKRISRRQRDGADPARVLHHR